jgi:AAA domain
MATIAAYEPPKDAKTEPFDPRDLDYFPPGEPVHHAGNGRDAREITATPFVWRDPRMIPPRQWLYGKHYIRKFISATVAPGGLGKTSLVLVEKIAMATGKPLLAARRT